MTRITNSGQNFPPRDSNNFTLLNDKVLNPRKEKWINPGTHYWGTVLEPHDNAEPPSIDTHSLSPSLHGNNNSLN